MKVPPSDALNPSPTPTPCTHHPTHPAIRPEPRSLVLLKPSTPAGAPHETYMREFNSEFFHDVPFDQALLDDWLTHCKRKGTPPGEALLHDVDVWAHETFTRGRPLVDLALVPSHYATVGDAAHFCIDGGVVMVTRHAEEGRRRNTIKPELTLGV